MLERNFHRLIFRGGLNALPIIDNVRTQPRDLAAACNLPEILAAGTLVHIPCHAQQTHACDFLLYCWGNLGGSKMILGTSFAL
jgi:hypothetical protein